MDQLRTGHLLKRINDDIERKANNNLKEIGLTMSQAYVLIQLMESEKGYLPLKVVEHSLGVAQPTAAGIVSRLELKGLISSFTYEEDKRVKIISLTENGVEAGHKAVDGLAHLNDDMFNGFSDEDIEGFSRLLLMVHKNVKD